MCRASGDGVAFPSLRGGYKEEKEMKPNIISGSALAAAAVALALSGASVAPAYAHGAKSTHMKTHCGGKGSCRGMAKCHHKAQCHHHKGHCNMKSRCHTMK
jgi:hypothetical protein